MIETLTLSTGEQITLVRKNDQWFLDGTRSDITPNGHAAVNLPMQSRRQPTGIVGGVGIFNG